MRSGISVALINPPDIRPSLRASESQAPPLGLASIAAYLRAHQFPCDLFDLALERPLSLDLLEKTDFFHYDVYGFTSYTKTFLAATNVAKVVRKRRQNALIVFGGPHASADAEAILRRNPEIDVIIKNEGEASMLLLVRHLLDGSVAESQIPGLVYRPGFAGRLRLPKLVISAEAICNEPALHLPDINHLPPPLRSYVIEPNRAAFESRGNGRRRIEFLTTSRGCPKRCNFCSIIVMSPKYRTRAVPLLMQEIKDLYRQNPFGHLLFHDANFLADWRRAIDFARALFEWKPEITWSGTATVDTIVRQDACVREIGALNCLALEVGVENGSDAVLKRLNKGITVRQCLDAVSVMQESGIHLDLDFIMFDGEMTLNELTDNCNFLDQAELSDYAPFDHLRNAVRLYPGTQLRSRAMDRFGLTEVSFDETLITPFANPEVEAVYKHMNSFLEQHGPDLCGLISALEQNAAVFSKGARFRESQQMYRIAISMRNLPYRLFCQLVAAANRGLGGLSEISHDNFLDLTRLLRLTRELTARVRFSTASSAPFQLKDAVM